MAESQGLHYPFALLSRLKALAIKCWPNSGKTVQGMLSTTREGQQVGSESCLMYSLTQSGKYVRILAE